MTFTNDELSFCRAVYQQRLVGFVMSQLPPSRLRELNEYDHGLHIHQIDEMCGQIAKMMGGNIDLVRERDAFWATNPINSITGEPRTICEGPNSKKALT